MFSIACRYVMTFFRLLGWGRLWDRKTETTLGEIVFGWGSLWDCKAELTNGKKCFWLGSSMAL